VLERSDRLGVAVLDTGDVLHDPIDRKMVRSINEIGHLIGMQTIPEWAESAEIIEVLCGLSVDCAQGYGVSQPQKVQRAAIA
jgi:EAL domain-containing protein (putative c-di-GMP-specific phosphodiesterase class I)